MNHQLSLLRVGVPTPRAAHARCSRLRALKALNSPAGGCHPRRPVLLVPPGPREALPHQAVRIGRAPMRGMRLNRWRRGRRKRHRNTFLARVLKAIRPKVFYISFLFVLGGSSTISSHGFTALRPLCSNVRSRCRAKHAGAQWSSVGQACLNCGSWSVSVGEINACLDLPPSLGAP